MPVSGLQGRALLLGIAASALATGVWGGLARLGWTLPSPAGIVLLHGPLMICGLFGTLIAVERAVALARPQAWIAPGIAALSAMAALSGAPWQAVAAGWLTAALAFLAGASVTARSDPGLPAGIQMAGAACWAAGCAAWLVTGSVPDAAGWWIAFLVLTVGGERLEMSRIVRVSAAADALLLLSTGLLMAGAHNGIHDTNGAVLSGLGLLAAAGSLAWRDIARRNVRRDGAVRFFAAAMLAGYAWLVVAGLVLAAQAWTDLPLAYDAALHAVLLGFIVSMVFGHALIILPAVLRIRPRYHAGLYLPLAVLQTAVAARVAGSLLDWPALRMASGPVAIAAMAGFGLLVAALAQGRQARAEAAVAPTE